MDIKYKLTNYKIRLARLLWQLSGDVNCAFHWHFTGNKKYFIENFSEYTAGHKWVFILGCNNSGTSVLQRIFNRSGQVSTWKYEGQRYTRVLPRAMRRGYERVWMEYADDLRMPDNTSQALGPRLVHDWVTSLEQPLKPVILEKTPANLLRMKWLQEVFPESYFIGLIRNGYAVAEGIRRKSHKEIGRAAHHWAIANKSLLEESKFVDRYLEIRYEDFFDSHRNVAQTLAEFTGLDVSALNSAMADTYRLKTIDGEKESRIINMNDKSIKKLSESDIATIRNNAAEMLDYFGYSSTITDHVD